MKDLAFTLEQREQLDFQFLASSSVAISHQKGSDEFLRMFKMGSFPIDTLAGWAHDKDILSGIDVLGNETLYLLTGNCSEGGVAETAPGERRTGPPEIVNRGKLPDLLSQPVIFDQYYAASQ